MLSQHPQIYMPNLKEPHYLADELAGPPPPITWPTTLADYLALFAPAAPGQLTGEASASYLWSRTAARNIARMNPNARIIIILREPVSFLRSLHLQYVKMGIESERDLRKALTLEDELPNGRHLPSAGRRAPLLVYSSHMAYIDQLRRYRETFSAKQLLVLIYDDFRADNQTTIGTILRFLEVDETVSLSTVEANRTTHVSSRRAATLLSSVFEGRSPGSAMVKAAVGRVTTPRLRRGVQRAIRRHVVYAQPQAPDRNLVLELRHRYKPEVVALTEYLGRGLVTLWGYDDLDCPDR